jgi:chromosome partitioning protein
VTAARAHVIVVGSEKAASGKTTLALNIAAALMRGAHKVGVIDLDLSQRTLSRILFARRDDRLEVSAPVDVQAFNVGLQNLSARCAYVIVDAPSGEGALAPAAHACADTLVTVLAHGAQLGEAQPGASLAPSAYSEMVWEGRKRKLRARGGPIDWVVLRNRLELPNAKNSGAKNDAALAALSARIGFRIAPGLTDRAVVQDLFAQGRDLLDSSGRMSMPHVAARQEFREFLLTLKLPDIRIAAAA